MVKAVWEVDRELAEVSTSFDLLLNASPTNTDAAWYYAEPKDAAAEIKGRVAFWRGVEVSA